MEEAHELVRLHPPAKVATMADSLKAEVAVMA